ncbi:asparagine synthase-related protein [Sphingomicrobium sp. XHP0235]|uniref:asparagine synthase-related protein n=1 Tax=Sphingomicrobium aquimarinum TaxID=3133971 RepID=UPI0031FF00B0
MHFPTIDVRPFDDAARGQADARLDNSALTLIGDIDDRAGLVEIVGTAGQSLGDAGLLLRALAKRGVDALHGLEGRFAGVYRQGEDALLFHDALGLQPLHYRFHDGALHVHSDALPLADLGGKARIDEKWLGDYLFLLPEEDLRSPFAGVRRVPAGCAVRVTREGKETLERWWKPSLDPIETCFDEALRRSEDLLDERLLGQGGAPLLLSSGVDSNSMLTRLAQAGELGDAITGSPSPHADVLTNATTDEYPLAHAAYGSVGGSGDHHRLRAAPSGLREAIEWAFETFQRPVYNPTNLGWMDGCHALAKGLGATRLFDGTQGNFTIGNFGVHPVVAMAAEKRWGDLAARTLRHRGYGLKTALRDAPPEWLARLQIGASASRFAKKAFMRTESDGGRHAIARARDNLIRLNHDGDAIPHPQRRLHEIILHLDLGVLQRAPLRRHGIELVDPFLNRRLVEFALSLPNSIFTDGRYYRKLQLAMLDPRLPEIVRTGGAGGVQGADWRAAALRDAGLFKQVIDRIEDGHDAASLFDTRALRKALAEWPASGWDDYERIYKYRVAMMRALTGAAFVQWLADR